MKYERCGGFDLKFYSYNGISFVLASNIGKEEAKMRIKARIKRARKNGQPVERLGKGRWEFSSPEDAATIGDQDGVLGVESTTRRYRVILGRKI